MNFYRQWLNAAGAGYEDAAHARQMHWSVWELCLESWVQYDRSSKLSPERSLDLTREIGDWPMVR